MDEPRPSFRGAYFGLLAARDLQGPSGKPLYEYRFTRAEYEGVAELLTASRGRFLRDPSGCALFVAFTAEWFRREREGGRWDWINPLARLGVKYHASSPNAEVTYGDVRKAAETGMAAWRRPLRRDIKILHCVIAESGFPTASIRQGPRLANWLKRSVLAIEAGFAPEEAVRDEAWRAGETLVQALFEPAVALCRTIAELRRALPPSGPTDPVQRLETVRPDWRTELPFALEEQDVRRLVEELVRVRKEETTGLEVLRRLRRSGNGWNEFAELELSGALDNGKLPAVLRGELQGFERVRVRPGGSLADFGRAVAALERVRDEQSDRWEIRPLVQGFDVQLPMEAELRLQALASGGQIAEFAPFGGEPVEGPAVVLAPAGDTAFDEAEQITELELLGPSPLRSSRPWLVIAVEHDSVSRLRFERQPKELGVTGTGSRRLFAFEERVELELDGERLVWRAGDERQRASRLRLVGDTVWRVEEHVFKGSPDAWRVDGDESRLVPKRDLLWREVGAREWFCVEARNPVGRVEVAVRNGGELVAWTRATVLPPNFTLKADAKAKVLAVAGLAGARLAASDLDPLDVTFRGDTALVDLARHARGAPLRLTLRWTSDVTLTLPDPVTQPVLLNVSGAPLRHARISVARMPGHRLLAPQPAPLLFELRRRGVRVAHAVRVVDGLTPLAAFRDLVRQLLGASEDLDADVRVTWLGQGDWSAEIGWYDYDRPLCRSAAENASPFEVLAKSASPRLTAFSLSRPGAGVDDPPYGTEAETCSWLDERLGNGPWLLSGEIEDGCRLRPRVLGKGADTEASPLLTAGARSSRDARDSAFDDVLVRPTELTPQDLRHLVELCVTAQKADAPGAAVDAMRAVCRNPSSAVFVLADCRSPSEREAVLRLQTELPMLWCATRVEDDWMLAFASRRDRLAAQLDELGEDVGLAESTLVKSLVHIADLQPGLRMHARAALISMGGAAFADAAAVERLCRMPGVGLPELVQDFRKRHGTDDDPPARLDLAAVVPERAALWRRHDAAFADVIAAPLVAARAAMGHLISPGQLAACRWAWIYDRDYFENALLCALRESAQAS